MHPLYNQFLEYLLNENKKKAVNFILSKLKNKEIDIITLHSEIMTPALNTMFCDIENKHSECIWKEHIRTSIVRTIIECSYPYIIKEREEKGIKKKDDKVIVVCPSEEYHEIGARIVVDFFTLLGFDTIFIGANTPRNEIEAAIELINPKYVAISVTTYYNLVEAEKAINFIREKAKFTGKIIVGGTAFINNPEIYKKIGADLLIQTFDDIKQLTEGESK